MQTVSTVIQVTPENYTPLINVIAFLTEYMESVEFYFYSSKQLKLPHLCKGKHLLTVRVNARMGFSVVQSFSEKGMVIP